LEGLEIGVDKFPVRGIHGVFPQFIEAFFGKVPGMIDIKKFQAFEVIEIRAVCAQKYETIPVEGIMARCNGNPPAVGGVFQYPLEDGSRKNTVVEDLGTAGSETGDKGFADKFPGRPGIGTDNNGTSADIS